MGKNYYPGGGGGKPLGHLYRLLPNIHKFSDNFQVFLLETNLLFRIAFMVGKDLVVELDFHVMPNQERSYLTFAFTNKDALIIEKTKFVD